MTIESFVKLWSDGEHDDIDVYDDVCEELAIAYCGGGYNLTDAGKEHFKEVLTYDIDPDIYNCIAVVHIDDEEGVWQKKLRKAKEFFYACAGYCSEEDFDKWFVEA